MPAQRQAEVRGTPAHAQLDASQPTQYLLNLYLQALHLLDLLLTNQPPQYT